MIRINRQEYEDRLRNGYTVTELASMPLRLGMDRVEVVITALDCIARDHGTEKPTQFGKGNWNFDKEIVIYKAQVKRGEKRKCSKVVPFSESQWETIDEYIIEKRNELIRQKRIDK